MCIRDRPPAICAAANTSIQLIQREESRRRQLFSNVKYLRQSLTENGVEFKPNLSHITIIPVAGAEPCRTLARQLLEKQGIYLQPINFPTVPVGEECLRVICTARHLPKHIHHLAWSLKKLLHGVDQTDWEKFPSFALAAGDSEGQD